MPYLVALTVVVETWRSHVWKHCSAGTQGGVSEQILNGTSAQLGYTVPFTSVHAEKYRTEDKLKTDTLQNKKAQLKKGWLIDWLSRV